MSKLPKLALVVFLLLSGFLVNAQSYTIQKWYNGKKSATVLTFDDWSPGHGPIAVPALVSRGLTGTFFVTTGNSFAGGGYTQMKYALDHGNEIGNHTANHYNLSTLTPAQLVQETSDVKTTLETQIAGAKVESFCYPRGDYNDAVITEVKKKHFAARAFVEPAGGVFNYEFATTVKDYYEIKTIEILPTTTAAGLSTRIRQAINTGGLLPITFHSIYNSTVSDSWFDAIPESTFNLFLDSLQTFSSKTWITTFANAVKYHREAHAATLTTVSNNTSEWVLNLTDTLANNTIYNHPLTIKLKKVSGEVYSAITQNGQAVAFSSNAAGDSLIFNAVPDGGQIKINKSGVTVAITSPANNASFTGLSAISLSATASAIGSSVSNVTYTVNGQTFVTTSPYTVNWTPTTYGTYTIQAVANAANGKSATTSITVKVVQQPACSAAAWVASQAYSGNALVSYNNHIWKAKWWTQNEVPGSNQWGAWEDQGVCGARLENAQASISSLTIYPNPATEVLNVYSTAEVSKLIITDTKGSVVKEAYETGEINVSSLEKGIYIIQAISDAGVQTQRFIKQ